METKAFFLFHLSLWLQKMVIRLDKIDLPDAILKIFIQIPIQPYIKKSIFTCFLVFTWNFSKFMLAKYYNFLNNFIR